MRDTPPLEKRRGRGGDAFALGAAALAIVGCCGMPLLIALAGSAAIGTLLGVGGGVIAALLLGAMVVRRTRTRRRACNRGRAEPRRLPRPHR